ncbi:molybdopterin cofactor-binding domain-containing protein [Mycobacterium sp. AZCC_0083]|uniref:molybdopterin cofactor-binding domain-containing protein n=1 Tax=Mycobacterium sp. AZCC_0083 TaxID=2735882 RepID=UPI0016222460|nr:molybdopterin cofactor-binding domain-containing protein [Mycobacterium sp. AZCC_0083]MBB5167525.1 CO/xanthine dehydrogenase Mo-binding subunit/CO/xanthine dehydrogenase FAD-binding subunit [Mycobacterium sp. AZCC_0083]
MNWVGTRARPVDWESKTLGVERYAGDVQLDGLLHGAIVRSPYPYATIRGIDAKPALAVPGVVAIVTADDIPGQKSYIHSGGDLRDRPHLARGVVRYVGEEVAAVAGETPDLARQGAQALSVRYRRKRAPLTVADALDLRSRPLHTRPTGEHNVAFKSSTVLGDYESTRAASAANVREHYVYPRVGHAPMETNATTAAWDENGRLHLWTSSQSPWFVAEEVANALAIPQDWVICHDVSTGGGFGSKSHVSEHEVIAALLAHKAGRPVRLQLTREEEFGATKPRHAFYMDVEIHADSANRINLIDANVDADNGAYNHYGPSVLMRGLGKFAAMYRTDCVRWEGRLVDTALPPGGQFRGYGGTQTTFALESAVDELAYKLGIDPLEFRIANANQPETTARSGIRVGSARLKECLERVRDEIDWTSKRKQHTPFRGVGVAAAIHGSGTHAYDRGNESEMKVVLHSDGTATATFGGADAGTGQRTIITQALAHELGLDLADVRVIMNSTETFDYGAWGSRGTHMSLHAARQAGSEVADAVRAEAAVKLATTPDVVELRDGRAWAGEDFVDIGDLVPLLGIADEYEHTSTYTDPRMERIGEGANYSASYCFAAHAVEVEVDPSTGHIEILSYVAAHDVGRAINPTMVEGQICGGAIQGLGAALGEEVLYEGGRPVNPTFLNYPLFRSVEAPAVRAIIVDGEDGAGPYGAKSVGEIPILPPGPAVANAVFDAIGIRFRELPITPDKIIEALQRNGSIRPKIWRRPSRWQVDAFRRLYPLGLKRALMITSQFSRKRSVPTSTEFRTAETLEQARSLASDETAFLAGGTDLLPRRQQALNDAPVLVSLSQVRELRNCRTNPDDGWTELGAALTLSELAEGGQDIPHVLSQTARDIATPLVRELATLGGNLLQEKRCWFYRNGFQCYKRGGTLSPCYAITGDHRFQHAAIGAHRCQAVTPSDLATTLLALDAQVEYVPQRGEPVRVSVDDFFVGPGENTLPTGAVMIQVRLPPAASGRSGSFKKLALWQGDFAICSVAITADLEGGRVRDPRVVLGGMAPTPVRLGLVEDAIEGVTAERLSDVADRALVAQLEAIAHPLPRNRWKLEASRGALRQALCEIADQLADRQR